MLTNPTVPYVLNVKAIVASFNQEKALVGAFSVIVQLQTSRRFVLSSSGGGGVLVLSQI